MTLSLIPSIGKSMKFVEIVINNTFKDQGLDLTKNQYILLKVVNNMPMAQKALTLITECNKSSLTRLVTSLENKGLVGRSSLTIDKRINTVAITPKGQVVLARAEPVIETTFEKILAGVNRKERQKMLHFAETIMQNAKREIEKLNIIV